MLKIYNTDALTALREMDPESVQMCVTSPPYWGLRDYGVAPIVWDEAVACEHEWETHLQPSANGQTTHAMLAETLNESSATRKPKQSDFCACGAWRGCFGLEPSPELYTQHLVQIFREVRRVLRSDGVLFLNLGDSYAGSWGNYHPNSPPGKHGQRKKETERFDRPGYASQEFLPPTANISRFRPGSGRADGQVDGRGQRNRDGNPCPTGLKAKDLIGIPWMAAFALRADGWWLRSDIIWAKPNPMPESVTDRPTRSHEYVFLLTKSDRYFFDADAVREPLAASTLADERNATGRHTQGANGSKYKSVKVENPQSTPDEPSWYRAKTFVNPEIGRNVRSVWTITTQPFADAHFAVFPTEIPRRAILAGTSARGCCPECGAPWVRVVERTGAVHTREPAHVPNNTATKVDSTGWKPATMATNNWQPTCKHTGEPISMTVLDPFGGSGTTGKVAIELGRKAILIEPKAEYCEMIESRTRTNIGLPLA